MTKRTIFLVGFMAAGKSSVGEILAPRLGLPFLDLDREIEAAAGKSVPEIFAADGEEAFRRLEREAVARVASGQPAVIATGGGAPCDPESLEAMRESGLVVALHAPLDILLARAGTAAERPLLALSEEERRRLYRARVPVYRQAHAVVRTDEHSPEEAAALIAELVARAESIPASALGDATLVSLPERSYPVLVAEGLLDQAGELLARSLSSTRVGVVTDEHVAPLYGARFRRSLEGAGLQGLEVSIPAGEEQKSMPRLEQVAGELIAGGLDRSSAVAALGGGVVGDLAGLAAATLFRGVACVQVPTTLVAMVDSAIGGKTAVNLAAGKNLLGAFWQPALVLADPTVLATLPPRERRAAFGELLKYALLDGEELYDLVDRLAPSLAGDEVPWEARPPELAEVIRRCASIKAWIVALDERERNERALLNLGHTVGHAIEAAAGYGTLLHGEAVALGLLAACRVSRALDLCGPELEERVRATLARAGLDTALEPWLRDDVIGRIGVDKKRSGARIRFIALREAGDPEIVPVQLDRLSGFLRADSRG